MSKATVVSTLPFKLTEPKPGLNPPYYEIPAAPYRDISILQIREGFHLQLIPLSSDKTPPMKIEDSAEKIAESLILDYVSANIAIDYDTDAVPGMFWVENHLSVVEIKVKHISKVEKAFKQTEKWFENLIKMADDDWSKTRQHRAITDLQRSACKFLNLSREWDFSVAGALSNLCWSCKVTVHPDALLCANCKAVLKPMEYEKRKAQFATIG